jgi:hypothetical protein
VFSAVTAAAVACKAVTVPRWQSSADAAYSPDRISYKEALDDILHFVTGPTALEHGLGGAHPGITMVALPGKTSA